MTASEINTKYTSEKLNEFGFQPVGVIVLGDTTFLFKKDQGTLFALEPVDPTSQRDYFRKQTERLNQKNYINIPNVDATQVTYSQLNSKETVKVNWIETTGGADKPEIEIPVTDAIFFEDKTIELNEDVLRDLFLPKDTKGKLATFFTMETADQEVVGIAIRGNNPKLVFLPAASEGSRTSTIAGLNNFLDSVYLRLLERATQIQKQVDGAIFEASLPTKELLIFSATATKKSLADVHKKIYQIQALLISLRSDDKLGMQDPAILAHAPFLRAEARQGALASILNKVQKPVNLVVDGSIWTSLNEAPGAGLITTPPRSARPVAVPRRVEQRAVSRPVPPRQSVPERARPEPVRQLTEKQKAINLAREIDSNLNLVLTAFKDFPLDTIGLKQVQEMGIRLEAINKIAEKYISERKRGKEPANATPTRIIQSRSVINLAGVKDSAVFSFVTGSETVTNYKDKVEAGFSVLQNTIFPLMISTSSRGERMMNSIRKTPYLLKLPSMKDKVIPDLEAIAGSAGVKDVSTAEASYTIVATQISYILWARYQELKANGSEVEIDNWANYCYSTTDRLCTFAKEMTSK